MPDDDHYLRRRYSSGSSHQRRTDRLVRRVTLAVAVPLLVVALISAYALFGLRIGRFW